MLPWVSSRAARLEIGFDAAYFTRWAGTISRWREAKITIRKKRIYPACDSGGLGGGPTSYAFSAPTSYPKDGPGGSVINPYVNGDLPDAHVAWRWNYLCNGQVDSGMFNLGTGTGTSVLENRRREWGRISNCDVPILISGRRGKATPDTGRGDNRNAANRREGIGDLGIGFGDDR